MTDLISREAAIANLRHLKDLLNSQFEVMDISRENSTYGICIDAIRALPAAPPAAPAVKVKPLVWKQDGDDLWVSEGAYLYFIDKVKRGFSVNGLHGVQVTIEAAKAAAQSDYEARILSTLEGCEA